MKIDLDEVRYGSRYGKAPIPRVHGNGFIQLDIGAGRRLHVWGHRDLPRQKVDTGIHDHMFDFISTCIAGRVVNAHYKVVGREPTHTVYGPEPRDGEDTALRPLDLGGLTPGKLIDCRPYVYHMRLVPSGESYSFEHREFHETFTDRPSATIMQKGAKYPGRARVLVPIGFEPDNKFNRNDFPPERLWEIIHEVLRY
jgi:hypothetical protein